MLLVATHSQAARQSLRNVCSTHEDCVVRRFGRAALLAETELAAFHALRLREKHTGDVQVERTAPLNEFSDVPESVRDAATAYESRDAASTPYAKFAAGTDLPDPESMADEKL
ncbi:DUF7855 family protein [Halobacterium noricense]|uniref:DUF7855 family protein n=1 Tax=Halobacterium noricense TaxID=223182 RepID=UPI001E3C4FCF|nr:hypothetical protein [Halobacterium noricense]UHH25114.1 hypothetical protein LT974_14190 [Halobacterium noricense]